MKIYLNQKDGDSKLVFNSISSDKSLLIRKYNRKVSKIDNFFPNESQPQKIAKLQWQHFEKYND